MSLCFWVFSARFVYLVTLSQNPNILGMHALKYFVFKKNPKTFKDKIDSKELLRERSYIKTSVRKHLVSLG